MKIKRKNILDIVHVTIGFIFVIVIIIITIKNKYYNNMLLIAIVFTYLVYMCNKARLLMMSGIKLEGNKLYICQFNKFKPKNLSDKILNSFHHNYGPVVFEFDIKKIKKYGFIMDLKETFDTKLSFSIGFIDKSNNKYYIILNQFDEKSIFDLIKEINKKTAIKPIGKLENILKK